ncbi:DUF2202 domain-containing protein [bacterium]|nr:DUF2202 domain-containing protein [bacterium]MBU1958165.1 DUF2202 domain-containing protein [bacterium]
MLKQSILISTVIALLTVSGFSENFARQNAKQNVSKPYKKSQSQNTTTLSTTLSTEQKEGLIFMIEEEKVARDVYIHLYKTWGTRVFTNIAKSEQKHMDAVHNLLNKYNLEAPLTLDDEGTFENEELQALYDSLIAKGDSSLIDALEVGVMVEETDIADLKELIEAGLPSDIERVYNNLLKGSYNHLAAFNRQLARQ